MLRFWESRFTQIRPLKRGGGRRYYRPDDIDLLRGVRHLLYGEGYTIRGVQRILREEGLSFVQSVWRAGAAQPRGELEDQDQAESADAFEDDDEGEAGEDEAGNATSRPREPSFFPAPASSAARPEERREPNLIRPAAEATPARAVADGQSRQKLQAALEELVACRSLISAALADAPLPDDRTDDAG